MINKNLVSTSLSLCKISVVLAVVNFFVFFILYFKGEFSQKPFMYYVLGASIAAGVGTAISAIIFGGLAISQKETRFPMATISLGLSVACLLVYFFLLIVGLLKW